MQQTSTQRQTDAPFYAPTAGEIELFEAAFRRGLPVMLKGPTGCGKIRLVEHMAPWHEDTQPLIAGSAAVVDSLTSMWVGAVYGSPLNSG